MGRIIRTREAAKILGVTIYRINHMINTPCPVCGDVRQETVDGETVIEYAFGAGCKQCRYTGQKLPTVGRLGKGKRAPHLIDIDDLSVVRDRRPGYPEGKKKNR